ncbi:deleted in malignant brain tumors 1 protein-like [Patiria miniata]|uniref:SRCR domain-containing protein n=1 Tax=Patiria miniata TaxID=46514 RepID=A0A914AXA7_PATMI|nr:deleted in malignant brain tumors 1 protein-like [Patiria miniata]
MIMMVAKVAVLWMWFAVRLTSFAYNTPQKDFQARLVNGRYLHQGRVEVNIDGDWGLVCTHEWEMVDANVLCRQLGFPGAKLAMINAEGGGPGLLDLVDCDGWESNLGECHYRAGSWDCEDEAMARCQEAALPVRISNGVEIQYDSHWIPVCHGPSAIATAQVVCRQLGYRYAVRVKGHHREKSGDEDAKDSLALDFSCSGEEEHLGLCLTDGPMIGDCSVAAEVNCSNTNDVKPGDITRLSEVDVSDTGILQVKYAGDWWRICFEGVDMTVAQLVCHQLGFVDAVTVRAVSVYDKDSSKIPRQGQFGSLECLGTERTLTECKFNLSKDYECSSKSLAEVSCSDSMVTPLPDFQIRLVGGVFPYEGRVEISYGGQWGTVCDDHWGYADAHVVCKQLGFHTAEAISTTAYFGEGDGPILLDDVMCAGNETSIINCRHAGIGEHNCKHNEDAGVRCYENKTQLETLSPGIQDSFLPFIVILINGLIALLILVGCLVYCYLKIWDRYTGHTRRAHLHRTQDASTQGVTRANDVPMEYTEEPPAYHTVHENRDVYITQRSETPPPEYSEAMKLQADTCV